MGNDSRRYHWFATSQHRRQQPSTWSSSRNPGTTIHQAGPHRPNHHLLPDPEPQLPLGAGNRVPHGNRADIPHLAYLFVRHPPEKRTEHLLLTFGQDLQQFQRATRRHGSKGPGQQTGRVAGNPELSPHHLPHRGQQRKTR